MNLVAKMKELNTGGIILINNRVYNSINMLKTVVNLVTNINEYKVLEVIDEPILRSIRTSEWVKKGYKGYTKPWKISIHTRIYKMNEFGVIGEYKLFLEASNTYKRVVLGIFDSKITAEEFKNEFYKGGKIVTLVYCNNKNTKDWYEDKEG